MDAAATLTGISYVRNGKRILDGIDWRIAQGEHWALIGANGSGKTTLLKIVSGNEWPTSGRVEVLGRRFGECDLRELRKSIGWVSTAIGRRFRAKHAALDIVVSGIDAALERYHEYTQEEFEAAREALERVSAAYIAEQSYDTLSQGEQQRVLIARALVNRPALLILDEPCAGLDPKSRADFLSDVGRLASGDGAPTVVLVTHHIEEIGPWIAQVLALKEGRVSARGPVESVLTSGCMTELFDRPCRVVRHESSRSLLMS